MPRKNTKKRMRQPEAVEPDLFADEFFMDLPAKAEPEHVWDEPEERPKIAADKRRAMVATVAIFAVFAVAVGGFTIYTKLIMPTPVTLGASSATFTLPQAPPAYETALAPVAAPPPVIAVVTADVSAHLAAPRSDAPDLQAPDPTAINAETATVGATDVTPTTEPTTSHAAIAHAPATRSTSARAHAARPTPPPTRTAVDPNSLSAQAMRELNAGRTTDARRLAQQAVQAHPEQADGWIVLGAAHDALGNHDAAKAAYANCTARAFGTRVATCRALAR